MIAFPRLKMSKFRFSAKNNEGSTFMLRSESEDKKLIQTMLCESRTRLQSILDNEPECVKLVSIDGILLEMNQAGLAMVEAKCLEEVMGKFVIDLIHPEDRAAFQEFHQLVSEGKTGKLQFRILGLGGGLRWMETHSLPWRNFYGDIVGVLSITRNLTESKQIEQALMESEERYRQLVELCPNGIFIECEGKFVFVNRAAANIFGAANEAALIGKPILDFVHPDYREIVLELLRQIREEKKEAPLLKEKWLQLNGTVIDVEIAAIPFNYEGKPAAQIVIRDISERQAALRDRKRAEEQLRYYAFYDPLTGLPNRALFLEQLEKLIDVQQKDTGVEAKYSIANFPSPSPQFAVLFLDLNRFQIVKYSLGHQLADELIIATAKRLQTCLRSTDFVALVGLDEFAIILSPLSEKQEAIDIANCIYQTLQLPFKLDGREVYVTASIGIALSAIGYDRPEDFLQAADTAMHTCKRIKQAPYAVFEPEWHVGALKLLELETDLRQAIQRRDLQVYYQPIVSLKSGRISGFEALVRWEHPTRGFVPPSEFIPLAEETGLIGEIDRFVLREACRQMGFWQRAFLAEVPLTLSVNLSGFQLSQLALVEQIDQVLGETGIQRSTLKLEITESKLSGNMVSEKTMLDRLKKLGIQLAIDDFGTGYSSLARLHQLPIDTLKIDRSFVTNLGVDSESLEIVRTIITLAHSLEMDAIAEGVETPQQLAQLQALQCEYGQGYFFSKPIASETAWALLNRFHLP